MKMMLGHDNTPMAFWRENLITGAPLERCPVRTIQLARASAGSVAVEVDRYADTYYPAYKDGHLLTRGAVADQPARYLEMIGLIRSIDMKVENKMLAIAREQNASKD